MGKGKVTLRERGREREMMWREKDEKTEETIWK